MIPTLLTRAPLLAVTLLFAACPDDAGNPPKLWLAPDGSETEVRLSPSEPAPY